MQLQFSAVVSSFSESKHNPLKVILYALQLFKQIFMQAYISFCSVDLEKGFDSKAKCDW